VRKAELPGYPESGMGGLRRLVALIPALVLGAATLVAPGALMVSAANPQPSIALVAQPSHQGGDVYVSDPGGTGTQRSIFLRSAAASPAPGVTPSPDVFQLPNTSGDAPGSSIGWGLLALCVLVVAAVTVVAGTRRGRAHP
jgi:hypothetical protein